MCSFCVPGIDLCFPYFVPLFPLSFPQYFFMLYFFSLLSPCYFLVISLSVHYYFLIFSRLFCLFVPYHFTTMSSFFPDFSVFFPLCLFPDDFVIILSLSIFFPYDLPSFPNYFLISSQLFPIYLFPMFSLWFPDHLLIILFPWYGFSIISVSCPYFQIILFVPLFFH